MSADVNPEFQGFKTGDTAEDFANLVMELAGDEAETVVVPFEDFTLPDHIVFGGNIELQGHTISYVQLFGGALEHFHGVKISSWQATPAAEAAPMTPFSMGLHLVLDRGQTE